MDTILNTPPLSMRQMKARWIAEGCNHDGKTSLALNDGSKWIFDARYNHWACMRRPDGTGSFKLLAGAL